MSISRRNMMKLGAAASLGAGGLAVPLGNAVGAKSASRLPSNQMPRPYQVYLAAKAAPLAPYARSIDPDGAPVLHFTVTAREGLARILPKLPTRIWGYNGTFPGPRIELDQGQRATLRVRNHLPATHPLFGHAFATSTHLHGSASLPQFDGFADDLTHPDYYKIYQYPNFQNARTLWYHDHAVHNTAYNAYTGLAAQYVMHDALERRLLPQGEFDVPLTITDAMFASNGDFAYDDRSHSGMWGDVVLVNGQPWPVMKVKKRIYRFRMLNASLSRSYRPQLSTGQPVTVVATDGGLMPAAQQVTNWRHGMAERYEVLIDFSRYKAGQRVELRNLSNDNNRDYDHTGKIMAFQVTDEPFDGSDQTATRMPTILDQANPVMRLAAKPGMKRRRFRLHRDDVTNKWVINGKSWEDVVKSGYRYVEANPNLGDTEIWEIENRSGGWFHPTHIHLVDFRILSRNGRPPFPYELGPKDVVYVGEGETVRLLMQFGPHRGRYMIHCHNLPHEDHDMMTQFSVGLPSEPNFQDPLSAPCTYDDLPPDG